ncbi:hypothetical protein [Streptomyces sp. NPDC001933]|uniref:hypothetical protein n=1 Tax=Streptomyces sp. NPDC001933 TaxID=3364626 RepID=UPI00369369B0
MTLIEGSSVGRPRCSQITDAEHLPGVLVEHGHDALIDGGGGGLRGGRCVVGRGEAVDDLAGRGELGQAGFGLGEGDGEPLDLLAQAVGSCGGLVVFGLQQPQEFADVHAASSTSSRQVGVGVVRRRSMLAVSAQ